VQRIVSPNTRYPTAWRREGYPHRRCRCFLGAVGRDRVRSPATVMLTIAYGYRPAAIPACLLSALAWAAAFGGFGLLYGPILLRHRPDAKPGAGCTSTDLVSGAFIMHSDRASAAAAPEQASDEVNEEALAAVMRVVPL
jgi:hypothetical protein